MRHQSAGAHHSICRIAALVAAGVASATGVTFAGITPAGSAAENTAAIQSAIDAAAVANPVGTVTLGNGTFEIDAQLMVTGGVTLVGQGWTNTIIKQTANGQRVATLDDNSKLEGATITGGRMSVNWTHGAGLLVNDGTVSWCCVSNNVQTERNIHGGGIAIFKGTIDHSIVAFNQSGTYTSVGGGIGIPSGNNTVIIDTCLIYGNTASVSAGDGSFSGGAGFGNITGNPDVTIRNTTIADNTAKGKGGGIRASGSKVKLVNSIVYGNTAETDNDIHGTPASDSTNNFIGEDPEFVDAANGNYHLQASSLAAEVGMWYEGIENDLDGVARKMTNPAAGCYECLEVDHDAVRLGSIAVAPTTTTANLEGSITSLGTGSSATVELRYGLSATSLVLAETKENVVSAYSFELTGLTSSTKYFYEITAENNVGRTATASGEFNTKYDASSKILPKLDPAENVLTLNNAFATAEATQGTVTLGEGIFEIDSQLLIGGGITVVGQGWDKTIIKQVATTATANTRVAKIDGGAKLEGVTLTGGKMSGSNNQSGGGVFLDGGTISWCCISNNTVTGENTKYGGGVGYSYGKGGQIDHSIISDNFVSSSTGDDLGGGGIGAYMPDGAVTIDNCLVSGNSVIRSGTGYGRGGGIGINYVYRNQLVTIRNSTIVDNIAGAEGSEKVSAGGAVYTGSGSGNHLLSMQNCIAACNTTAGTNTTMSLDYAGGVDYCFFDVADDILGANSKTGDPLFRNVAKGDYRLRVKSPCVDAGYKCEWMTDASLSLDGKPRIMGRGPDMGCYETNHSGFSISLR